MKSNYFSKLAAGMLVCVILPLNAMGQSPAASDAAQSEEARNFRVFLADDWKRWMQEYPEMATWVGYPGQNRRWTDESSAGYEARVKHLHGSLDAMKQLHRDLLPASERLNYDLYLKKLQESEESLKLGGEPFGAPADGCIPITLMGGVQQ